MPRSLTSTQHTINPTLLAFKPRQVQLANLDMKHSKPNDSSDRAKTLSPDQKGPLLHAVARFLESNGFSKTLKKFRSEAEIEKSGLKDSLLDLEEMYCRYSEMCTNGGTNVNSQKEKEELKEPDQLLDEADKNCKEKKKKKSKIASDSLADTTKENLKDAVPLKGGVSDSETEKKPKDKMKKNKSSSDSFSASVEQHGLPRLEGKKDSNGIGKSIADDNSVDEKNVKLKGKKKKKDGLVSERLGSKHVKVLGVGDTNGTSSRKDDLKNSDVDATDKESKGSKKRKRLASGGNDSQPADNREDEESKRRKVEGLKGSEGSDASLGRAENVGKDIRVESGQVGLDVSQKASVTQPDGQANGYLDKSAEKSSIKKSMKKQQHDSAEPKTVNAFQRVKVDEVEFVDEKLRDNSYWAKDGAEIGYGAKAQEILGQVRGRDFRHEKTKKKRGTYRGGQIDLQSYSVKFNYSGED